MGKGKRNFEGRIGRSSGTKGKRKTITQGSRRRKVENGGKVQKKHGTAKGGEGGATIGEKDNSIEWRKRRSSA